MNKTKYQPGDKVRVKSDLKVGESYYMDDKVSSDCFMKDMQRFSGKIVTIDSISSWKTYEIKEDAFNYNWTDEMFEDIVPEYVECVKTKESYFIKGVIYKVINATNLVSAEVISNIKTGSYNPGNTLYITLKDSDGKQYYKNSTREAYEAQQKPKTPKFEVGKWYKNLGTNGNYIGKFEKLEETRWYCSDHIYKEVHQNYGGNLTHVFENAVECTVEEIQQYLPDGHPDKKFQFVVGEYYSQDFGDKLPRIFIYKNDTMQSYYINPNVSVLFRNNFDSTCLKNAVKATPEEKQWLNACIKADKFLTKEEALKSVIEPWSVGSYVVALHDRILHRRSAKPGDLVVGKIYTIIDFGTVPYIRDERGYKINFFKEESESGVKWFATKEEAEAFAKTLKPVITVESEMKRLGLAIGDEVKVDAKTVNPKGFYRISSNEFEQLFSWNTTKITGGIIKDDKLYLYNNCNVDGGVLAEMVTKVPDKFLLGSYDVKVTSNGVKIGCTTLPFDDVIGVLDDFMKISRKFGTESSDYIMINGVKVTYEIANKLLGFIGDN